MRALRHALTTCGLLAWYLCPPATASTVLYQSDAQLIARSSRVVHARVVSQRAERGPAPAHRIYTVTTLDVLEDFTGHAPERVDVWELGGTIDNESLFVGGQVRYTVGQEVLVCLERGPHGLRNVAMAFSTFAVTRTTADDGALTRNVHDMAVVGGTTPSHERTLAEFRQLAAQVLRVPSRRAPLTNPQAPSSVSQPFTKLGGEPGWRWREVDSGTPVIFYRNTRTAPLLETGDVYEEIQKALAAWTNPPSASIVLQYGGTTVEQNVEGKFTSIPARSGLITFDDPDDEIPPPVLAVGGGEVTFRTGGTVGGVTFDGFESAFVVFQNAADVPQTYKEPLDFSRVLTHELGHAIGFDHTQNDGSIPDPMSNIMFASCCYPQSPVPPSLGPDDLAALNAVYPVSSAPAGPAIALDKTSLRFGVIASGGTFVSSTSPQIVRLTQSGNGNVAWTATSTRPWLRVSPESGTGPTTLTVSVTATSDLPAGGSVDGAITFAFNGASTTTTAISVGLTVLTPGQTAAPMGALDTPTDNKTGVTGALPVTGWVLDDIEVESVGICRTPVAGESASADSRCGGYAQIFIGPGVFIDGARPDVQAAFPSYPLSARAGWGFMVLTNMLPGQGNGTYQLWAHARDREGHAVVLGARTITCDNAHATKPFGAIDTPEQGGTISGSSYVNFGWALTPQPKTIPVDGSTITVLVDGVSIGHPTYNNYRPDIASAFPSLNNTNGAVGFKELDTTRLANGLHTISWVVTDNQGSTEGIGSRYFTVSNSTSSVLAESRAALPASSAAIASAPIETTPVFGRRGWSPDAPWRGFTVDAAGRAVMRGEEVDRFEIWFGENAGSYTGYLRAGQNLAALPVGSRLDAATGVFTWTPGVGFIGTYDLVFVRSVNGQAVGRRQVRIILAPKGSGHVGGQVEIDTPRANAIVDQPFLLGGWAADLDAAVGTGIDTLHVWAYPIGGGAPIFLGATAYGGPRPDVASIHGDHFRDSGFGITVQALPPGTYDLAVFPWSNVTGGFLPPKFVRVTVR
jgi:hypothetical protein